MTNSEELVKDITGIKVDFPIIQDEAKKKISILDTAKIPFQRATTNLDRNLHDQITSVNDTLYAVRKEYDKRIDDQGCRSDLFWRLVGITSTTSSSGTGRGPDIYTFVCTRLGVSYGKTSMTGINSVTAGAASSVGLSTNTITYYDGTSYNNFNLELVGEGDALNGVDSGLDAYYVSDNLHGLKLYDEPYAKDVLDTFRGVGVGTIGISAGGVNVYKQIGLESYTSTHNAPILFTQALDDTVGSGNQPIWLQDYFNQVNANLSNATSTLTTVPTGGHEAFTTSATLQAAIRTAVGSTGPVGSITNTQLTIVPTDGETHSIGSTSYPVMGKLYVPTSLPSSSIDVVVVFHGTVTDDGSSTIQQASETSLTQFLDSSNLNVRDKIIFSAAYPQDHISNTLQYNLSGVGTETSTFLMGDNLPYVRAAVGWVQNSLDTYMATNGIGKTIGDVYLFGHSQGGALVSKTNTLDTGITGVVANSPDPIQFDQTCQLGVSNTSCSKVAAIYGITGWVGSSASNNYMTILTPETDIDIEVGQIVTPSISGYFASGSVTVTGVGTTSVNLAPYPFTGIATSKPQKVPYITVSELPIAEITAPIQGGPNDGEYVNMLFSQDPNTIEDSIAVKQTDNPYVNQTIEIMSYSRAGAGVYIDYTNSGIASGTRSWNKFLDGLPDPDSEDPADLDKVISEPPIGADKIYYRIGFAQKPVYPSILGGGDAAEGDFMRIPQSLLSFSPIYENLPSCDNTDLNAAISARDTAESNLASDSDFYGKIATTNSVKSKMNAEFNLRIWAYRMQIGSARDTLSNFQNFNDLITNSPYKDIMDQGSLEDFA